MRPGRKRPGTDAIKVILIASSLLAVIARAEPVPGAFHGLTLSLGSGRPVCAKVTFDRNFQIDLLPEEAPLGVSHFVTLARRGFYNGMNVQMIVKNAWFKTGCPYDNGFGHPGYAYKSEAETQTVALMASTGNTQGIRLRISPPSSAPRMAARSVMGTAPE